MVSETGVRYTQPPCTNRHLLQTAVNNLWLNQTLLEAVARPRLHHQLLPNRVLFEPNFPKVSYIIVSKTPPASPPPYLPTPCLSASPPPASLPPASLPLPPRLHVLSTPSSSPPSSLYTSCNPSSPPSALFTPDSLPLPPRLPPSLY